MKIIISTERVVKNWIESSCESGQDEDKSSLKDLLFFLHVPRTGGRTYFHCFLRKLYTSAQECPRSYEKLRFDPSKPNCRLVVSHDDYSLISKLPKDRTSVVTIFRKPVDRVFSTYEFSVEVAARFLVHPNLTSAKQMPSRIRPKSRGVSTLDIWPWKYLVPWMREDLFDRARLLVPEAILQQIISLNSLDVELYRHAESIFSQQKHHIHKAQGAFMENRGQMIIENRLGLPGCTPRWEHHASKICADVCDVSFTL